LAGIFFFAPASRPVLMHIQPLIEWIPRALAPGENRPAHEDDHSPPSSAEVKNTWSYISTPPYVFTAWLRAE